MWKTTVKLMVLLFLRSRFNHTKTDLSKIKRNIADLAENRAASFKQNFKEELQRIVHSAIGFMLAMIAIACASITAIMWIAASTWSSPHRDIILGCTMLLLILIGFVIFAFIYYSWKKVPLFNQSMLLIGQDWRMLRGLEGSADTTDAND